MNFFLGCFLWCLYFASRCGQQCRDKDIGALDGRVVAASQIRRYNQYIMTHHIEFDSYIWKFPYKFVRKYWFLIIQNNDSLYIIYEFFDEVIIWSLRTKLFMYSSQRFLWTAIAYTKNTNNGRFAMTIRKIHINWKVYINWKI